MHQENQCEMCELDRISVYEEPTLGHSVGVKEEGRSRFGLVEKISGQSRYPVKIENPAPLLSTNRAIAC